MSDVHFMLNDWALPPMSYFGVRCAGHEGAGVVVKVGKDVKGWKVGDRAGIKPLSDVCHNCEVSTDGQSLGCLRHLLILWLLCVAGVLERTYVTLAQHRVHHAYVAQARTTALEASTPA